VVHGREPRGDEVPMRLVLGDPRPLDGWDARPLASFAGRRVHAVAGIGHPPRFFAALREAGLEVDEHAFPDHHAYEARDFVDLRGSSILMTGKDAVKCRGLGLVDAWEVPVRAVLPDTFLDALNQHLRDHPRHVEP
jgi:tetraacyldisaccharide 4'-kinase